MSDYGNFGKLCPSCNGSVHFDHVDDVGTSWFKCERCGQQTSHPRLSPISYEEQHFCEDCTKFHTEKCRFKDDKAPPNRESVACLHFEEKPCVSKESELSAHSEEREYFDEQGTFIPKLLADEVMSHYHFATMIDNEEMYVYLDGYYQPYGEVLVKKECRNHLGEEYRKNRASEVIDYIKTSTYMERKEEPTNLIPVENGVLDLQSNPIELKPYSHEYMFFNKIPVKYDAEADCPNIENFHREVTKGEEDATVLGEVIGFCLYRDYFIAKALMLVGEGSNGKSTWLGLVKRFLGVRNVSGRSLQDLEEHRFAKADLHTKIANIYADLPDKALFRTGMFKMLTGRDLITAERKFQNPFHFVNYAKLLFSANKVPEAYDDTSAFFRRWIIIVFPNVFSGSTADPYILDKLCTEQELSGLLNLALKGLKSLLENGDFSYSKTTEEVKEDYIRKSSPITAFVMDSLETDSDAFIIKKDLYSAFAEYCRQKALPTVTQDTFFKNLPQHVAVAEYRPKIGKERYHTFKGIRYSPTVSVLSTVSKVFYHLIAKKEEFREAYEIEELPEADLIRVKTKIGCTVDTMATVDTKQKLSLQEKLGQIKTWLLENKDAEGLVNSESLVEKCKQLGLDAHKAIRILLDESQIFEVPAVGRWGVK